MQLVATLLSRAVQVLCAADELTGAVAELLSICCAALNACVPTMGSAPEGELTTATPCTAKLCIRLLTQHVTWSTSLYILLSVW